MKTDSNYPTLGKYGRMRRTYLKEHKTILFNQMLLNDTLWLHLCEVDKYAFDLFQTIVEQMAKANGVNEQLKANDQWRWIQEMGNIRNAAEEFVLRELVYT